MNAEFPDHRMMNAEWIDQPTCCDRCSDAYACGCEEYEQVGFHQNLKYKNGAAFCTMLRAAANSKPYATGSNRL